MSENSKGYDELYKSISMIKVVIMVGDSSVGKTSFLIRLTKNILKKQTQPTIGVEYAAQSILLDNVDKVVKAIIWDTAGAEKYKAITTAHYRKSHGALLFYDVTDQNSFDNVVNWKNEKTLLNKQIMQHTDDRIVIMLVGNKIDIINENQSLRKVDERDVQRICDEHNMLYEETSAKEGINVKNCFERLIKKIYEQQGQFIEEEIPMQSFAQRDPIESEKKTDDKIIIGQPSAQKAITLKDDSCCGFQS